MFKSILLPVDLGQESSWNRAAPAAVSLARQYGAKVNVVTVVPDYGMSVVGSFFTSDHEDKAMNSSAGELRKFVDQHVPEELRGEVGVVRGTIYREIEAAADRWNCDLIVMTSHRPEMADYLLGPNAARVVRHAKQSVFVIRP